MFTTYPDRRTMLKSAMLGAAAFTLASRSATALSPRETHIVLLHDSVFDNGAYVGKGPAW